MHFSQKCSLLLFASLINSNKLNKKEILDIINLNLCNYFSIVQFEINRRQILKKKNLLLFFI